jgi:hypothetical protein
LDGGEKERRGEGRSDDEVAVSALILATETTKSKVRLGSSFLRAARFCGGWGCNCGMVGVNSAATVPEWIAVSGGHGQDLAGTVTNLVVHSPISSREMEMLVPGVTICGVCDPCWNLSEARQARWVTQMTPSSTADARRLGDRYLDSIT